MLNGRCSLQAGRRRQVWGDLKIILPPPHYYGAGSQYRAGPQYYVAGPQSCRSTSITLLHIRNSFPMNNQSEIPFLKVLRCFIFQRNSCSANGDESFLRNGTAVSCYPACHLLRSLQVRYDFRSKGYVAPAVSESKGYVIF